MQSMTIAGMKREGSNQALLPKKNILNDVLNRPFLNQPNNMKQFLPFTPFKYQSYLKE